MTNTEKWKFGEPIWNCMACGRRWCEGYQNDKGFEMCVICMDEYRDERLYLPQELVTKYHLDLGSGRKAQGVN